MASAPRKFLSNRNGNIGMLAAIVLPLLVFSIGLGVDYAYLSLQRRELQSAADLIAIVAAADLKNKEQAALGHLAANDRSYLVRTPAGLHNTSGKIHLLDTMALHKGIVTLTSGRYSPDPAIEPELRFLKDAANADAVNASIRKQANLFIAHMFADPPVLQTEGTAAAEKIAAFSVGSRLASLNGGLLNSLLGAMLGTSLSLKVMDYNALIGADISIRPFLKLLATELSLTAGTYDEVLTADLTADRLFKVMRLAGLQPAASSALKLLQDAAAGNNETFRLEEILDIGPKRALRIDAGSDWKMDVSAMRMIAAAASLANGTNQVKLDAGLDLPGLLSVGLSLAIGEPPVETPGHRLGTPGAAVRTAQTRLALTVETGGLAALAGASIKLPLYVEVAFAEARLANIVCYGGTPSNAEVQIDAVPGIAEIAIGNVDPSVLSHFSSEARVAPAALVKAPLLTIIGSSRVESANLQPSRLKFSPADIAAKTIKSVSTKDILTSLTQTLLRELELEIKIAGLGLPSVQPVQQALAAALSGITPQIDELLYNILVLAGVRVGEADVRATGVACQSPVLVQ